MKTIVITILALLLSGCQQKVEQDNVPNQINGRYVSGVMVKDRGTYNPGSWVSDIGIVYVKDGSKCFEVFSSTVGISAVSVPCIVEK